MDWYHFVKPKDFEQVVRAKLVEDLSHRVRRYFLDADVHCFGSFPAGLYLPISDMDLVMVSDGFMKTGRIKYGKERGFLRNFASFLKNEKMASPDSIEIISKAKVPLVKYIDKTTGLRIDISFENDTGIIANRTFQDWKTKFPAMPILVTLIKHLLCMRGLNEPVNGGIGGFSVTCLVVSLLQLMPQVQSGNMIPEHHLGEVLMEFLDLYGNQINFSTTGITLNPPGYFRKVSWHCEHAHLADCRQSYNLKTYNASKQARICIIDPNRSDNDLTAGASNSAKVLDCFSHAFDDLQFRMGDLYKDANRQGQSILTVILGGNYTSFQLQREHLAHVHEKLFGEVTP